MAGPLPTDSLAGHVADLKAQTEDWFPLQTHDSRSQCAAVRFRLIYERENCRGTAVRVI